MKKINFNIDQIEDIDNEGVSLSKQQYKLKSMQKELNDELFVDLGLPSGTLWCKYNLGVNLSTLNNAKDWYGNYYAWGELYPKNNYSWKTYKYCQESISYITKYNNKVSPFKDDLVNLLPEDDVAYKTCSNWTIPSRAQILELMQQTKTLPVKNYSDIEGLNGRLFISKTNENSIFIPFAGYINMSLNRYLESHALIWSSCVYDANPSQVNIMETSNDYLFGNVIDRCYGLSVRPVITKKADSN